MKEKIAAFLVPVLTGIVLLYQVFGTLQIAVGHPAALRVIGITLGIAAAAGALAALGPPVLKVGVLGASAVLFLDATLHLSGAFHRLAPENRVLVARDEQRITDLHNIKAALEQYVASVGPLPRPEEYGEGTGLGEFWMNWWDVSALNGDGDAHPFLDFLVDRGIVDSVPLDPVNAPASDRDPRGGKQYVYFLVPPGYEYSGGVCNPGPDRWVYLLGITDLEYEPARPPARFTGSGCDCLWRDQPNYFQHHFDYVLCGEFKGPARAAAAAGEAPQRVTATGAEPVAGVCAEDSAG